VLAAPYSRRSLVPSRTKPWPNARVSSQPAKAAWAVCSTFLAAARRSGDRVKLRNVRYWRGQLSRLTRDQLYLPGPGLINKAPSPNRSIPPIHSSWLDRAATPISLFNERRLPIKPNAPQTQKRPMRTARPTALDPGHHLIAMASLRLSGEVADAK
jgi:hypothetical protein